MASHGVARTARARSKEQREQDLEKILKYRALEGQLRLRLTDGHFGGETFQLTSQLLRLNPEYYTTLGWVFALEGVAEFFSERQSHAVFRQLIALVLGRDPAKPRLPDNWNEWYNS